jgi:hypothetical protein
MSNSSDPHPIEAPAPRADLKALGERLIGTWKVSGEAEGETSWEWMDGGFFLIQRGWTRRKREEQTYLQIIGHDRMPGSAPADAISGRLYTNHGDTLTYVCELEGDTMTIWMGEKGSPAVSAVPPATAAMSSWPSARLYSHDGQEAQERSAL